MVSRFCMNKSITSTLWLAVLTFVVCASSALRSNEAPSVAVGVFDQEVATHIGADQGLPVAEIHDVAVSKDGSIYVASDRGLWRFDGKSWSAAQPGTREPVSHVATRGENTVFFLSKRKLWRRDSESTQAMADLPEDEALSLATADESVLLGTASGLFRLSGDRLRPLQNIAGFEGDPLAVKEIAISPSDRVALATSAGFFLRTATGWARLTPHESKRSWSVRDARAVAFGQHEHLWAV